MLRRSLSLSIVLALLICSCADFHQQPSALLRQMKAIAESDRLGDRAFVEKMLDIRIDEPKRFNSQMQTWRVSGWLAREDPKVAAISYSVKAIAPGSEELRGRHIELLHLSLGIPQTPCLTLDAVRNVFDDNSWKMLVTSQHIYDAHIPDQRFAIASHDQTTDVVVYFQTMDSLCAHAAAISRYY